MEVLPLARRFAHVADRAAAREHEAERAGLEAVETRASLAPLSLSRPTLATIVSFKLRKASFLANSPHAHERRVAFLPELLRLVANRVVLYDGQSIVEINIGTK